MKAYEIQQFGIDNLAFVDRDRPEPASREVLVKFHAASLNYRDLMIIKGSYNPRLKMPRVPFSDGAGEVIAVGEGVSGFKVGDRVCPIFHQGWIDGDIEYRKAKMTLGGDLDGCLREFGTFSEDGLVHIPQHLSYDEAATLPCAAVTAWNGLIVSGRVKKDDVVLIQGTGGVSLFALQFARLFGARTIIISSSDEKLDRARKLGADLTINYTREPDWDKSVLELTERRGVDHVIEVGGAGTMQRSLNAVRLGGHIAVIGVLAGKGEFTPVSILMKAVRMQGVYVGSHETFEEMNKCISSTKLRPVIDRVFDFTEAKDALRMMENAAHFGKIVVRIC